MAFAAWRSIARVPVAATIALLVLYTAGSALFGWTSVGLWKMGVNPVEWLPSAILHGLLWSPCAVAASGWVSVLSGKRQPTIELGASSAIWIAIWLVSLVFPPRFPASALNATFLALMGILSLGCAVSLLISVRRTGA